MSEFKTKSGVSSKVKSFFAYANGPTVPRGFDCKNIHDNHNFCQITLFPFLLCTIPLKLLQKHILLPKLHKYYQGIYSI